eukprot:COSAG02_NODE_40266_length_407_cov_0.993506_1_plen_83_part_01
MTTYQFAIRDTYTQGSGHTRPRLQGARRCEPCRCYCVQGRRKYGGDTGYKTCVCVCVCVCVYSVYRMVLAEWALRAPPTPPTI